MVVIDCSDGSCPYEYYCSSNFCYHYPVFPMQPYPIFIYVLFPIASAICNISGNSMGQFKVLLLMDALNYSEQESTVLCYPLIVGPALYNFLSLIPKRHPTKDTSIVDYNMVAIILPSSLFGSIFGAIVNKLIPPIVADVIIILLLAFFSVRFFLKLKDLIVADREKERQNQLPLLGNEDNSQTKSVGSRQQNSLISKQQSREEKSMGSRQSSNLQKEERERSQGSRNSNSLLSKEESRVERSLTQRISDILMERSTEQLVLHTEEQQYQGENPYQEQLDKQNAYESTYHIPHLVAILVGFFLFQILSIIAQGRLLLDFKFCTRWYIIGVCLFTLFYAASVVGIFFWTKRELQRYKRIRYHYKYPLDNVKYFFYIGIGSFFGGFIGGAFSLGNTTTIIFVLIYLQVEAMVVTATCGFQVVFSGGASLIESIARGQSDLKVVGLFFGLTFIGGGILSYITHHFIDKLDKNKINKVLMAVIAGLTGVSTLSMVVNIILSYISFGSEYMIEIPPVCT